MEKINILTLDLNTIGTMRNSQNSFAYINSNNRYIIDKQHNNEKIYGWRMTSQYTIDVLTTKELRREQYGAQKH